MSEAHTSCNSIYTNVDDVRDRLRQAWKGPAAERYSEAVILWLEELRLITNDMNQMIGTFGGTVRAMHAVEDQAVIDGSQWISQLNPNQAG
ncbi:hypothetical protein [Nocardiopsis quinghaiensis]|uniref:hypothetical protein n=1 Tax=Nocardiopsis quinghaiensis TaxID=464995 RepID=UPI00123B998C